MHRDKQAQAAAVADALGGTLTPSSQSCFHSLGWYSLHRTRGWRADLRPTLLTFTRGALLDGEARRGAEEQADPAILTRHFAAGLSSARSESATNSR